MTVASRDCFGGRDVGDRDWYRSGICGAIAELAGAVIAPAAHSAAAVVMPLTCTGITARGTDVPSPSCPEPFCPQQRTAPIAVSTQVWSSPAAIVAGRRLCAVRSSKRSASVFTAFCVFHGRSPEGPGARLS